MITLLLLKVFSIPVQISNTESSCLGYQNPSDTVVIDFFVGQKMIIFTKDEGH